MAHRGGALASGGSGGNSADASGRAREELAERPSSSERLLDNAALLTHSYGSSVSSAGGEEYEGEDEEKGGNEVASSCRPSLCTAARRDGGEGDRQEVPVRGGELYYRFKRLQLGAEVRDADAEGVAGEQQRRRCRRKEPDAHEALGRGAAASTSSVSVAEAASDADAGARRAPAVSASGPASPLSSSTSTTMAAAMAAATDAATALFGEQFFQVADPKNAAATDDTADSDNCNDNEDDPDKVELLRELRAYYGELFEGQHELTVPAPPTGPVRMPGRTQHNMLRSNPSTRHLVADLSSESGVGGSLRGMRRVSGGACGGACGDAPPPPLPPMMMAAGMLVDGAGAKDDAPAADNGERAAQAHLPRSAYGGSAYRVAAMHRARSSRHVDSLSPSVERRRQQRQQQSDERAACSSSSSPARPPSHGYASSSHLSRDGNGDDYPVDDNDGHDDDDDGDGGDGDGDDDSTPRHHARRRAAHALPPSPSPFRHRPHWIFAYGTLKRGWPNHALMRNCLYEGTFVTVERYPLVVGGKFYTPYLLNRAGDGNNVRGEVYRVDDDELAMLDVLENIGDNYHRQRVLVRPVKDRSFAVEAFTYLKCNFGADLLQLERHEEYVDRRYVPRHLRHQSAK